MKCRTGCRWRGRQQLGRFGRRSVDQVVALTQVELGLPAAETYRWQIDDGGFVELIDLGVPTGWSVVTPPSLRRSWEARGTTTARSACAGKSAAALARELATHVAADIDDGLSLRSPRRAALTTGRRVGGG
jgi:hypothetical protein